MKHDEIQRDIELCETVLNGSNSQQQEAFYSLQGKYGDLPLSQLQTNPLFLSHHPSEYRNCILVIKAHLQSLLSDNSDNTDCQATGIKSKQALSKVFVVHGHNEALKQSVARLIEKQETIEPIILHEKPNKGATIIEKFERNSDVGAAICLFTADDVGRAKGEQQENDRARQNVVFEAGFFMGSLGRDRIILLAERGVEIPSDIKGVVYTDAASWQIDLLRELRAMGFSVDYNKID